MLPAKLKTEEFNVVTDDHRPSPANIMPGVAELIQVVARL